MLSAHRRTVAEVAEMYQVTANAVLGWIASKELEAINIAQSQSAKRPSWRITDEALARFEQARATSKPVKTRRSKQAAPTDPEYVDYF